MGEIDVDVTYNEGFITQVIRPAAIVPEEAANMVLVELSLNTVRSGGLWLSEPSRWMRYDRPWLSASEAGPSQLLGAIQVAYGVPTRYEITIYRVVITKAGHDQGWTVEVLCDEALALGDLSLSACPRALLPAPPKPFRF